MNDDADPVLVREPEAEHKFIAAGDGTDRRQIDRNDFVVVGPRSHPAHIPGSGDAVAALRGIASTRARLDSRRDRSGTDVLEHRLRREAGIDPPSIMASRCRRRGLVQQPRGNRQKSVLQIFVKCVSLAVSTAQERSGHEQGTKGFCAHPAFTKRVY